MDLMLIIIGLLILLILLNVPISYSIGAVSIFYFLVSDLSLEALPQRMFSSINSSTLFAIPLFLLAGYLMNHSGVTGRIYDFAYSLVGHIRGGLAHVNVLSAMMFASMSGSAVADLVGLGTISSNAMSKRGYKKSFAAALTLASSTITPIIPPSIILVVYGVVAEVSIGRLFLAGILPGLLIGIFLMGYSYFISIKKGFPKEENKASLKLVFTSFRRAMLPLFTPVLIIGGIILGVFTATEAGAVAVLYVLILGFFVYKELNWKKVKEILLNVGVTSSVILFLISISGVMGWVMTMEQIPVKLADALLGLTTNPFIILIIINFIILIAGLFLDATPIVLMLVPVLLPVILKIEMDPVQFGILIGFNTMIGLTTPPVGVGLYALSSALKVDVLDILKELWPMWITLILVLLVITFCPALSLFIPNLVFGK
jgi:C4-dicarboxylate transporter, DctM subunit